MNKKQKLKKFTVLLAFSFLLFSVCSAQDYLWPTNATKLLTSSFAETRPNRFHSGIDIKTWGKEGYKVFATKNGFIWKVRISPYGYGKVIYQILDSGEIVIYAHLQKFSASLENVMRRIQKQRKKHSVTKIFKKYEFPVKKGDHIAYTGSTGIGVPHLHFEIRNNENLPINPLLKGFKIKDTVAPVPTGLGVVTMNLASQINGWPTPQIFSLVPSGRNEYTVDNPIQIWGMIGFSVSVYDRANGARNRFAPHQVKMFVDDEKIFHTTYDKYSFNHNTQIMLDRNDWFLSNRGRYFHNLYLEKQNKLPFYHSANEGSGIIYTMGYADSLAKTNYSSWLLPEPLSTSPMAEFDNLYLQMIRKPYKVLQAGQHIVRIELLDFFNNKSVVHVPIIVGQKQKPQSQWRNSSNISNLIDNSDKSDSWFYLDAKNKWQTMNPNEDFDYFTGNILPTENGSFGTDHFEFLEPVFKKMKLDKHQINLFPEFIVSNNHSLDRKKLDLNLVVRDPYAVVEISSEQPILMPLLLHMRNKSIGVKELDITAHNLFNFSSWVPAVELADDTTTFVLYSKKDVIKEPVIEKKFFYNRIPVNQNTSLPLPNDTGELTFSPYTSSRDIYLSTNQINADDLGMAIPGDSLLPIYDINPKRAGFLKSIEISLSLPDQIPDIHQVGIYEPNLRKKEWGFVSNQYDEKNQRMKARIISLSRFSLLRDDQPPKVVLLYPANGRATRNSKPTIRINYIDNLSKIGGEEDFELLLDGEFCIAELDPEVNQIKYTVDKPLKKGWHKIDFWIQDRAQNRTTRSYKFLVESAK